MSDGAVGLPDDLVSWIEEVGGGRVVLADRMPGGARKEAWFIDLDRADGTVASCFLRYDRSDPARTKDPWTLHREATVYLALQDGPVPVPRVLGVHPVHQAMLSERVRGRELVLPHHRPGRAGGDGAGLHDEVGGAARARRVRRWTCLPSRR